MTPFTRVIATVIIDPAIKKVLWVGRGRGREDIRPFFELLGSAGRDRIKAVAMDGRALAWRLPRAPAWYGDGEAKRRRQTSRQKRALAAAQEPRQHQTTTRGGDASFVLKEERELVLPQRA